MKTIERYIISALIRDMKAQGYEVAAVWNGEEYAIRHQDSSDIWCVSQRFGDNLHTIYGPLTETQALEEIDSVDESTLHFTHCKRMSWGNRGVLLILGNGEDVINDHHSIDDSEPFNSIIAALCARLNDGELL